MIELELFPSSLGNWMLRGFLYTFLGIVAKEQHTAMLKNHTLVTASSVWAFLFVEVSSWCIVAIGLLYFLLGLFCLKRFRDRFRGQYQVRMRGYKAARSS